MVPPARRADRPVLHSRIGRRETSGGAREGSGTEPAIELLIWAVVGFVVGVYGTLVGAGGGFIMVPIFLLFLTAPPNPMTPAVAAATSLAVVFFNAVSGSVSYLRQGRVDIRTALIFGVVTFPGAIIGSLVSRYFASRPFYVAFGVLLILIAIFLNVRPDPKTAKTATLGADAAPALRPGWVARTMVERDGTTTRFAFNMAGGIALSFVVGFISSIFGIGGGIIHVPAMVFLFNFPPHIATATSLLVLVLSSGASTITNILQENIRWLTMIGLTLGVIPGAQAGAALSRRVGGKAILRALSFALAVAGVRLLFKE